MFMEKLALQQVQLLIGTLPAVRNYLPQRFLSLPRSGTLVLGYVPPDIVYPNYHATHVCFISQCYSSK